MSGKSLPGPSLRITEEKAEMVCRMAIRQVPHVTIARALGIHRDTVRRVLKRKNGYLVTNLDLEQERAGALAVYREVQRTAWEGVSQAQQRGRSTVMLLGEVRQAQQRIDGLLGLAPADPDDPTVTLERFKAIVVSIIQKEAPDMAPKITQRLLEARHDG